LEIPVAILRARVRLVLLPSVAKRDLRFHAQLPGLDTQNSSTATQVLSPSRVPSAAVLADLHFPTAGAHVQSAPLVAAAGHVLYSLSADPHGVDRGSDQ